jgi:hypothetical protein
LEVLVVGYTSVSDVELEWNQTVPDASLGHVVRLIQRAERIVARKVPTLAARITAGTTTADDVRDVVAAMVVRVLRNPDGKQSESAGDYSYQLASGAAGGRLYLASDELNLLLGGGRRASSIPLSDDALSYPLKLPAFAPAPREWTVYSDGSPP